MKYTHVAPEVATGTHPPSHASDVYALGCLLRQIAAKIGFFFIFFFIFFFYFFIFIYLQHKHYLQNVT